MQTKSEKPKLTGGSQRKVVRRPIASFIVFAVTTLLVLSSWLGAARSESTPGLVELVIGLSFIALTGWCWRTNWLPRRNNVGRPESAGSARPDDVHDNQPGK